MEEKAIIIEDNLEIINFIEVLLKPKGFTVDYAQTGQEGLKKIKEREYNFVILDLKLPDIDGFEVLEEIKKIDDKLPVVIITGFGTIENVVKAIKAGADDFIDKPFEIDRFYEVIEKITKIKKLEREISKLKLIESILELNRTLVSLVEFDTLLEKTLDILNNLFSPDMIGIYIFEKESNSFLLKKVKIRNLKCKFKKFYNIEEVDQLKEKSIFLNSFADFSEVKALIKGKDENIGILNLIFDKKREIREEEIKFLDAFCIQIGIGIENSLLFEKMKKSYINAIKSLVISLEAKDKYTKGHSDEVAQYSIMIGEKLGFKDYEIEILKNSSYLHDIGKLGIKDEILLKNDKLDEKEFEIIKQHPLITLKIIEPLNLKKDEIEACLYHHERINGSGYPYGITGENIPIYAKIIAVADAYSAMTSERPYRKKMSKEEAIEELRKWAGIQFDKDIVELFIEIINQIEGVKK
ncbi:MAG: response regulator [Candidatus Omnitrophica bacterium]|nr:response regulator [Candidatus Omnitrophota bacterium]